MNLVWFLPVLAFGQDPEPWWNADWAFRRVLILKNLREEIPRGAPISVELEAGFLGLKEKCRPDFADLRVVVAGEEIPRAVQRGPSDRVLLTFGLPVPLGRKRSLPVLLYYGNPAAEKKENTAALFCGLSADFDDAKELESFRVEGCRAEVREGKLRLSGPGHGRLFLKGIVLPEGFRVSLVLQVAGRPETTIRLVQRPEVQVGEELAKRVAGLIAELGADDFGVRENASSELIKIGVTALGALEKAERESTDPEVRWRAGEAVRTIRRTLDTKESGITFRWEGDDSVGLTLRIEGRISEESVRTSAGQTAPMRVVLSRASRGEPLMIGITGRKGTGEAASSLVYDEFSLEARFPDAESEVLVDDLEISAGEITSSRITFDLDVEQTRK